MSLYLSLFFEYFKIGLFSVGGGLATVPFLTDLANRTNWFSLEELANMIAVAESTPGPIGVNVATYVGYKMLGIPGALVASLGLVLPSFICILLVSLILEKFRNNAIVNKAFLGIRPASTALITSALYSLCLMAFLSNGALNIKALILGILVFICMEWVPKLKDIHPVLFILISAVFGVILKL